MQKLSLQARLRRTTRGLPLAPAVALVLVGAAAAIGSPAFLSFDNITTMVDQAAIPVIIATGLTFVILTGSIDLSVEGLMAVGSMSVALLIANDRNTLSLGFWALPVVIAVGAFLGLLNGLTVTRLRIPSFLVTIAMWSVGTGIALILFGTTSKPQIIDSDFISLSQGTFLGFTWVCWIAVAIVIMGLIIQRFTRFGRYVFVIGGSEEIAKLSGVPVRTYRTLAFMISAACSALAGALIASRTGVGSVNPGDGLLFLSISSVVIGGTVLIGGRGGVLSSVIGVLIMTVIVTGMILVGVSGYFQQIVQGAVLLVAVIAVGWKQRRPLRVVM